MIFAKPERQSFKKDELVIVGAPVYGGRIYRGALEKFEELQGDETPCIVTVTYGNRHYDDALLELSDFMKARGFCPVAAAALVGEHTFGDIQKGRPFAADKEEDREFGLRVKAKLEKGDFSAPAIPGNRPYKEGGNGGSFRPLTSSDKCISCGICKENCPRQAIGDDFKTVDSQKCISCFRCIKNCPTGAKNMNVPAYNEFAAAFSLKLAEGRKNEYYL